MLLLSSLLLLLLMVLVSVSVCMVVVVAGVGVTAVVACAKPCFAPCNTILCTFGEVLYF